jgi:hypothetical protein
MMGVSRNIDDWPALDVERVKINVPPDMRAARQWVVWKLQRRNGKPTKVPYDPKTGRCAESNNSSTWATFEQALRAYLSGGYSGVGFVFASGWCGIDIDKCRNPVTGQIEPWALDIVAQVASYTEISPSLTGLHIFARGKLPSTGLNRAVNGHKVEIYDSGRFFTFTGLHLETSPHTIQDRQKTIEDLYGWVVEQSEAEKKARQQEKQNGYKQRASSRPVYLSDDKLLDRARNAANGAKFERLWSGDIREYADDAHPEGNPSCADMAFVSILCFWAQDDAQVERLWIASKLRREKLDRSDYVVRTIRAARANQSEAYTADYKAESSGNSTGKQNGQQFDNPNTWSELTSREQIICRCFAYWNITDESFRAYIALRGQFGSRKTARLGGAELGRHTRSRKEIEAEGPKKGYENTRRFGNRRLSGLLKVLKANVSYPLLTRIEKGGKMLTNGRRQRARYRLDETPFDEAERLAAAHPAMILGTPDYNPGRAREEAALEIAMLYSKDPVADPKPDKPKPDAFEIWVKSERNIRREGQKIADAWDDLGKTTGERMDHSEKLTGELKQILLSQVSRDFRRKRNKKQQDTGSDVDGRGTSTSRVYDERMAIAIRDAHQSVNNTTDTNYSTGDGLVDALLEDIDGS